MVRVGVAWTHIFLAKREAVLHRFLCLLIVRSFLRLVRESKQEIDQDQCLHKDVPLEGEIAQLGVISHSCSKSDAGLTYL